MSPADQRTVVKSHVASTSSTSGWECTFHLGDKVLPTNSFVQTWRKGLNGQISDSLGNALLLLVDINHYVDCRDKDVISKLKWHIIAVSISIPRTFL